MRFSTVAVVAAAVAPAFVSAVPIEARAPAGGAKPAAGSGSNRPASTAGQWAGVVGSVADIGTRIAQHVTATRQQRDLGEELFARDLQELEARAPAPAGGAKPVTGGKPAGGSNDRPASTAGQWADVVGSAAGIGTRIAQHVTATRQQRDLGEGIFVRDLEELEAREFEELEARKLNMQSIGKVAQKIDTGAQIGTAIAGMFGGIRREDVEDLMAREDFDELMAREGFKDLMAREEFEDLMAREDFDELVSRDLEARARGGGRGQSTAQTAGQFVQAAGSIADMGMAIHDAVRAGQGKRDDFENLMVRDDFDQLIVHELVARARGGGGRGLSTAQTVGSVVGAAGSIADLGMAIHGAVLANKPKRSELEARKLNLQSIGKAAQRIDTGAQIGTAVAGMFGGIRREDIEDLIARDDFDELVARDLEVRARRGGGRGQSTAEAVGSMVQAAGSVADLGMAIHGAVMANKPKREFESLDVLL